MPSPWLKGLPKPRNAGCFPCDTIGCMVGTEGDPWWQAADTSPTSQTTAWTILHHSLQAAHTKSPSPFGKATFCSCRGWAQVHQMFSVLHRILTRVSSVWGDKSLQTVRYNDQRNWLNAFSRLNWMVFEYCGGLLQDLHSLCLNFNALKLLLCSDVLHISP